MALHLDSFIQLGGSPLSPGLAVPDNSQGLLSDMYTDYSGSGPLFEDFTSTGCKGADTETDNLSFLMGYEELSSLTEIPSSFSLEEEWLTQPTQLPLTLDETSEIPFTSVSPFPPSSSEWLTQSTSLPLTPEKQEGDITFSSISPAPTPTPYTTSTSANIIYPALTPDSSLPATPLSSRYNFSGEEELDNFLAIFEDGTPTDPIVIPSDPLSPSSSFGTPSPLSSTDSVESIRDLLLKSESPSPQPQLSSPQTCARTSVQSSKAVGSRKRKSSSLDDDPSYQPSRPTSKRRLPLLVKKEKKREQNKNAALRYRQRKKGEKSDIEVQRQQLEDKNVELKKTVESLSNEINYLKKLWQEVMSAKKRKQQS